MTSTKVPPKNTARDKIRQAIPSTHPPLGVSITGHMSVKVPQCPQMGWHPLQDTIQESWVF